MSVELMVEVLRYAPAILNPTERLTLVAIAESCRADTRLTYYRDGWDAEELARRVGVTAESLTKVFRSLARKGFEVRVAHAVKDGRPVFAFKGKQTTFRLPRFAPQRVDESPVFVEDGDPKDWTSVRQSLDESPVNEAQSLDESPPLLLKALPSKNPSSLSPRETIPTQRTEREDEEVSQTEDLTPVQRLITKHGATGDQIGFTEGWIDSRNNVQGPGFYFTADRNGSLAVLVGDALVAYEQDPYRPIASRCTICDDEGEVGDYLNRRPCVCLWDKDEPAARSAFIAQLKDFSDCDHGIAGGDMKAPNGWQHCSLCRGPGWADRNKQGRTDSRSSTGMWRPPADESAYDRPFSGEVRSPADRRVAEGAVLYAKYKAQEQGPSSRGGASPGAIISKNGSVRMVDSHHPDRNYNEDA